MHKDINNIIIVGGGSAGWMAASNLCLMKLKNAEKFKNLNITLVESGEIQSIGVGEGTTPPVAKLIDNLNIDMDDVIGTIKKGIEYKLEGKLNEAKFNSMKFL